MALRKPMNRAHRWNMLMEVYRVAGRSSDVGKCQKNKQKKKFAIAYATYTESFHLMFWQVRERRGEGAALAIRWLKAGPK